MILLLLKKLIAFTYDMKIRFSYLLKLNRIYKLNRPLLNTINEKFEPVYAEYRKLLKINTIIPIKKYLKLYSSKTGVLSSYYIPEYAYYEKIEPVLNNKSYSKAYSNKNNYDNIFEMNLIPKTYFRMIEGVLMDKYYNSMKNDDIFKFLDNYSNVVIKISNDSGGGKGVGVYEINDTYFKEVISGKIFTLNNLFQIYGINFICQEAIKNHAFYRKFNESSLNTVRVFTYRSVKDEEIHVLHTILRVGLPGKVIDNQASGGFACGVTSTGLLTGFAVKKDGSVWNKVNNIVLNKEEELYEYQKIVDKAKNIAKKFQYSRLLGIDLCIDENSNVRLIEVNNVNNEINFYQMCNGPLFGNYTSEILEFTSKRKKNYCFDFDV